MPQTDNNASSESSIPKSTKMAFLKGQVSWVVVALVAIGSFAGGYAAHVQPPSRFATADKGAVILEAVLDRQSVDNETIEREVALPIMAVLEKWQKKGYVVIDTSRDSNGNLNIVALPEYSIDITEEMRNAVKVKK